MNAIEAQELYLSLNGYNKIEYLDGSYCVTESLEELGDEIIEIIELGETCEYVYDIETDDGTFGAGVGSLIVKNTDSVFCTYKGLEKDVNLEKKEEISSILEECFKIGDDMAEKSQILFKNPIRLEFEKIYLPWFSFGKKMYAGVLYEPNSTSGYLDKKGICLKRRDVAPITKKVYSGVLDIFFSKGSKSLPLVLDFLNEQIESILNNEIDISECIISKTYKSDYKAENIPHKILAERMKERDPGNAPAFNDRVPYVFIETKDRYAKQYEKVEHPDYVTKHNLKLDGLYYMDKIKNPVSQLLVSMMSQKEIDKFFDKHSLKYRLRKQGQTTMDSFLKKN